ncbi:hypothetical protein [Arthrobacter sp. Soil762]|uniref:hypothetical protein n=1 Tax=Arthrobacter sp. Soil762 TaxID=1736401 RepID=UPI0012E3BAF2|nr:hypothetical protein [Arthrobacter sp. Soil762]
MTWDETVDFVQYPPNLGTRFRLININPKWGQLKKILVAVISMSALLVAGCSGPRSEPDAGSTNSPSASANEFTVSAKTTCDQLMGSKSHSTFLDSIAFVKDVTNVDSTARSTASKLSAELSDIAKRAEPDVKTLVNALAEPVDGLLNAAGSYDLKAADFKAAGTELINRCADLGVSIPYRPDSTPFPSPIQTTGSYGADLASAGIVPDNVTSFGQFMKEFLCDKPLSGGYTNFSTEVKEFGSPGSESSGRGPAVVRLTVAYFCPARAADAERELRLNGYVK